MSKLDDAMKMRLGYGRGGNDGTVATIRQAATVVLLRDGDDGLEVLMVRRHQRAGFAAGAWVFPGGAVDPHESEGRSEREAAMLAAVRECEEEAGVVPDADRLVPFAYWVTPQESPKRFATWFFVCPVDELPAVAVDGNEVVDHRWSTPAMLIADHRAGELSLMPPTYVTLHELSQADSVTAAVDTWRQRGVVEFHPHVVTEGDRVEFLYQGDAGYESRQLDVPGPFHRCYMDASGVHYRTGDG